MQKYRDIVLDNAGNAILSATITVTDNSGGGVSTIYSDDGVTPKANPFTASGVDGAYEFYAANGRYDITIAATGFTTEQITDIILLDLVAGTDVQAWDAQLDDIAALAVTDGNVIVGDGTNWVAEAGATARTSLGAAASGSNSDITELTGLTTDLTVAQGGTGAGTFTDAGVLIGNGTGAVQVTTAGTSGQVLTSNGAGVDPTFQALSGLPAASQAEMEAATSNTVAATPGRTQYHPGVAKAWVNFNGTGTVAIADSYNVTSIDDNGTGDYTINFTNAMSSANYVSAANTRYAGGNVVTSGEATTSVDALVYNTSNVLTDANPVCVVIFGDQ